jgi:hypothetical protein
MTAEPLFKGLVFDENDQPVSVSRIGDELFYVVNDAGFLRHIPADQVDRQVLKIMQDQITGNEDLLADQTAKMLGQEDIFTRALINNQLKHIGDQMEGLLKTGIPEEGRAYMGMLGFKVIINYHGEVIDVVQPSRIAPEDEE